MDGILRQMLFSVLVQTVGESRYRNLLSTAISEHVVGIQND